MQVWDVPEEAAFSPRFNAALRVGVHAVCFMFDAGDPANNPFPSRRSSPGSVDSWLPPGAPKRDATAAAIDPPSSSSSSSSSSFERMRALVDRFDAHVAADLPPDARQRIHKLVVAGCVDRLPGEGSGEAVGPGPSRLSAALHRRGPHARGTTTGAAAASRVVATPPDGAPGGRVYLPWARQWAAERGMTYCEVSSARNEGTVPLMKAVLAKGGTGAGADAGVSVEEPVAPVYGGAAALPEEGVL